MTTPTLVSRSMLERLAFDHPEAVIVMTADRAHLTLDGREYVAVLTPAAYPALGGVAS